MEFTKIKSLKSFLIRPLTFEGTKMHPNVLLMCKLLVLLLISHHIISKINDPFIPYILILDYFNQMPGVFQISLRVFFVFASILLFFNYYVRSASIVLGCTIIFSQLASISGFYNHVFICGCALFLAGLTNNKQKPWLLYLQLSLIYFGASLNKFMDIDWWSGDYMHNWLLNARENPFYINTSSLFPKMWLAKFLSWMAMFSEFLICFLILTKKYRSFAIWCVIVFNCLLFTITSFRFGYFLEGLLIYLIALLNWPKGEIIITYRENTLTFFRSLVFLLDWDKKILFNKNSNKTKYWIELKTSCKTLYNDAALKYLLRITPAFYIMLFVLDSFLYITFRNHRTTIFIVNIIFAWSLIVYFLPISWSSLFKKKASVNYK